MYVCVCVYVCGCVCVWRGLIVEAIMILMQCLMLVMIVGQLDMVYQGLTKLSMGF